MEQEYREQRARIEREQPLREQPQTLEREQPQTLEREQPQTLEREQPLREQQETEQQEALERERREQLALDRRLDERSRERREQRERELREQRERELREQQERELREQRERELREQQERELREQQERERRMLEQEQIKQLEKIVRERTEREQKVREQREIELKEQEKKERREQQEREQQKREQQLELERDLAERQQEFERYQDQRDRTLREYTRMDRLRERTVREQQEREQSEREQKERGQQEQIEKKRQKRIRQREKKQQEEEAKKAEERQARYANIKKIKVIADPEGYNLITQAGGIDDKIDDKTDLYVCGDIIDSTFIGNLEKEEKYISAKSYNLHNIRCCAFMDNVKLIFGNRDLNKLKCKYLCTLKEIDNNPVITELTNINRFIESFNAGDIDLSFDVYNTFINNISKYTDKIKDIWAINNLNSWYPFWGTIDRKKKGTTQKDWSKSEYDINKIFYERFIEIFGQDTVKGTMSADNLLISIPAELKDTKLFTNTTTRDKDYKAFVILALFKSMCISYDDTKQCDIRDITNSSKVRGWLCEMYKKGQPFDVIDAKNNGKNSVKDNNNIYLLSHGGLTKNLINGDEKNDKSSTYYDRLTLMLSKLGRKDTEIKEFITNASLFYEPPDTVATGGFYDDNIDTNYDHKKFDLDKSDSKKNILSHAYFIIKNAIDKIINNDNMDKPDVYMLFLLIITSPFDCKKYLEKLETDKYNAKKKLCDKIYPSPQTGPIMPGIFNMRKLMYTCTDRQLYQIIGHRPVGIGATIDEFKDSSDNVSYLITLDNSNSFLGKSINALDDDNKSQSRSILEIDLVNKNTIIDTQIKIVADDKKIDLYQFTDDVKYNSDINILQTKQKIILSKTHQTMEIYNIKNIIKDKSDTLDITKTKKNTSVNVNITDKDGIKKTSTEEITYCYHGDFVDDTNSIKYHIFTQQIGETFNSIIYILSEEDFKKFFDINLPAIGGSYIQDPFYEKYIKYKNKYLELKKQYKL